MKKIIYPTDGSPTAKEALWIVADLAKEERSEVIVVGVVPVMEVGGVENVEMGDFVKDAFQGFVSDAVSQLKKEGILARGVVKRGHPPQVILQVAYEEGADMIVMGTHGRTGLARAIIGSVADRIVRHSKVPVVLVPAKED
ncbi:MAG: universal stress protein [Firmicutes bacterium]|nr:universal stress protein [Bacillota bacterium]